jgi:hypothetical protein
MMIKVQKGRFMTTQHNNNQKLKKVYKYMKTQDDNNQKPKKRFYKNMKT